MNQVVRDVCGIDEKEEENITIRAFAKKLGVRNVNSVLQNTYLRKSYPFIFSYRTQSSQGRHDALYEEPLIQRVFSFPAFITDFLRLSPISCAHVNFMVYGEEKLFFDKGCWESPQGRVFSPTKIQKVLQQQSQMSSNICTLKGCL